MTNGLDSLRWWVLPAALLLVMLIAAAVWNHQHGELVDARRRAEAAQLTLQGQVVTSQKSAGELKADVGRLLAENADLKAAYDAARAAAPGAQPIHAETLSTGPVVVAANPRPVTDPPGAEDKGSSPAPALVGASPSVPAAATCVLAAGDQASIEVEEVALQTKGGNVLVVGTAAAWRESPARTRLFGGPFKSAVSDVSGLPPPMLPRWGAGAAGQCMSGAGCAAGPALLLPPFRIFGFQLEATLGVTAGPQGLGALGFGGIRW